MSSVDLDQLSEKECQELLAAHNLGRIAFVVDEQPEIFPVNYVADGSTIVFRTADDTKLLKTAMRKVAFEIDGWDATNGTAWSVMVRGVAQEITGGIDRYAVALRAHKLVPLAPGKRERWLSVYASEISGRRFRVS